MLRRAAPIVHEAAVSSTDSPEDAILVTREVLRTLRRRYEKRGRAAYTPRALAAMTRRQAEGRGPISKGLLVLTIALCVALLLFIGLTLVMLMGKNGFFSQRFGTDYGQWFNAHVFPLF